MIRLSNKQVPLMAFQVDKSLTSSHNPLFRDFRECLTSKGIRKHGLFLVSGERAVQETLERFPTLVRNLLFCSTRHQDAGPDAGLNPQSLRDLFSGLAKIRSATTAETKFSVIALAPELFDQLDTAGTRYPLLALRAPEIPEAQLQQVPQGLEILCALGDPSNVGALLRSAAAFGASKVILLRESASPFHPKAVRAASATTLLTELQRGPSIQEIARLASVQPTALSVAALDMNGTPLHSFQWPKNIRLLLGEEGQGVPPSRGFQVVSIPMARNVESLNATVASSLALYSYRLMHPL